jgi:hypothetical protein
LKENFKCAALEADSWIQKNEEDEQTELCESPSFANALSHEAQEIAGMTGK